MRAGVRLWTLEPVAQTHEGQLEGRAETGAGEEGIADPCGLSGALVHGIEESAADGAEYEAADELGKVVAELAGKSEGALVVLTSTHSGRGATRDDGKGDGAAETE